MKHLVLLILFMTSCDYAAHHDTPLSEENGLGCDTNSEPPPGNQANDVTYDELRAAVLEPKCIGCHSSGSASGGVDLSTYSVAKTWANQIKAAVVSNAMPKAPNPPLMQDEKDFIVAWVDSGALNAGGNQNCDGSGGGNNEEPPVDEPLTEIPPDVEITYSLVREKIFALRCFACHSNAGGNTAGLNLETFANTIDEVEDIYEEVSEQSMPPAPRPSLNNIERTTLLRWIELGSPTIRDLG